MTGSVRVTCVSTKPCTRAGDCRCTSVPVGAVTVTGCVKLPSGTPVTSTTASMFSGCSSRSRSGRPRNVTRTDDGLRLLVARFSCPFPVVSLTVTGTSNPCSTFARRSPVATNHNVTDTPSASSFSPRLCVARPQV